MTDVADEAGGEAIYSSDGLPPLPTPRTPRGMKDSLFVSTDEEDNANEDELEVDTALIDPADSSAIMSKLFLRQRSQQEESHAQKMERLHHEIATLGAGEDSQALALELSRFMQVTPQQDLIHLVNQHLEQKQNIPPESSSESATEPSSAPNEAETAAGGIVYELYGGRVPAMSSVEDRILRLEQMIGSKSGIGAADLSLLNRVADMEKKIKRIEKSSIEEAATKAKVIRADLEAASKARSKLSSASSNADNKAISELHALLTQLEGVSDHLPALTHRLQQLAHLHVQSSGFSHRLGEAETSLQTIQGNMMSLENSLAQLQTTMAENVKSMDTNLKALEEKVK